MRTPTPIFEAGGARGRYRGPAAEVGMEVRRRRSAGWRGGGRGRQRRRGTAVTGGTAAAGDDDESERGIERGNEKLI
jgi:hypothetical protein